MAWQLWPASVSVGLFGDEAGYDRAMHDLLATGAALDDGMIYWDARLSARYPTVEVRVADVCTDLEDALLIGALARALVETAARDWHAGLPALVLRPEIRRAAGWRAARHGIEDTLVDPRGPRLVAAGPLVEDFLAYLRPALEETGNVDFVRDGWDRLRGNGTGATFQRRAFAERGELVDVVRDAARRTIA